MDIRFYTLLQNLKIKPSFDFKEDTFKYDRKENKIVRKRNKLSKEMKAAYDKYSKLQDMYHELYEVVRVINQKKYFETVARPILEKLGDSCYITEKPYGCPNISRLGVNKKGILIQKIYAEGTQVYDTPKEIKCNGFNASEKTCFTLKTLDKEIETLSKMLELWDEVDPT